MPVGLRNHAFWRLAARASHFAGRARIYSLRASISKRRLAANRIARCAFPGSSGTLLPEAVEYDYDDDSVGQSDGCSSYKIVYDDLSYHWYCGSNGWFLCALLTDEYSFSISGAITRTSPDGAVTYAQQARDVYNVSASRLTDFDILQFSTTWQAFKALSDASEYGDVSKGVTAYSPWLESAYDMPSAILISSSMTLPAARPNASDACSAMYRSKWLSATIIREITSSTIGAASASMIYTAGSSATIC